MRVGRDLPAKRFINKLTRSVRSPWGRLAPMGHGQDSGFYANHNLALKIRLFCLARSINHACLVTAPAAVAKEAARAEPMRCSTTPSASSTAANARSAGVVCLGREHFE